MNKKHTSFVGKSRNNKVRVKSAKGRRKSSILWLQRHINDPYVQNAKINRLKSRAAWKLIQIDDKLNILKKGNRVVDLGAAPGGWTQIAVKRVGFGNVIAMDVADMDPIDGAIILKGDVTESESIKLILENFNLPVNVVLSDMAAKTTGHRQTDHLRTMTLCEAAVEVSLSYLSLGGTMVAKVFQGGAQADLLVKIRPYFNKIRHYKPDASRKESPETYLIARGFKRGSL